MNRDKDELEQFIAGHKDLFNAHEPGPALWLRVKRDLDSGRQPKTRGVFSLRARYYGAAAAVLVLLGGAVFYFFTGKAGHSREEPPVVKTNPATAGDSALNRDVASMPAYTDTPVFKKEKQAAPYKEGNAEDEALYHYTRLVAMKQTQLKAVAQHEPRLYQAFEQDAAILETSYEELKKQLKQHDDKEALLQAMLNNLQMQVHLLSSQLEVYKEGHKKKQDSTAQKKRSFL
ncbi:hypothetical protein [Niabella drilacis]|uniref:Uncharacterized protein n=1 Tax=Niabella drilacis (strain DSM 25811 / CCM 8410 / CCUG 62505 / LMG 26954 / E90) TaxID=1285928 RepID=A0A1G6XNS2_NIADE|nr:hypothetical protein [Niabella drilacis]SDD78926.1 hypothetical protein SAMN04487894_113115 [Niabella drilacis]